METTSATYRITTRSGTVVAADLPRSAPAIQLQEGVVSKGDLIPMALVPGQSTIVAYPLVLGRLICRVTRMDGCTQPATISERASAVAPIEFIEPDPVPTKGKPKVSEVGAKAANDAIAEVKTARRGRGKRGIS